MSPALEDGGDPFCGGCRPESLEQPHAPSPAQGSWQGGGPHAFLRGCWPSGSCLAQPLLGVPLLSECPGLLVGGVLQPSDALASQIATWEGPGAWNALVLSPAPEAQPTMATWAGPTRGDRAFWGCGYGDESGWCPATREGQAAASAGPGPGSSSRPGALGIHLWGWPGCFSGVLPTDLQLGRRPLGLSVPTCPGGSHAWDLTQAA